MDEPKVEAQYCGENKAIKLLRLADGDFQIRTYRDKTTPTANRWTPTPTMSRQ